MRTPAISGISGKFEGARGDTAGAMVILLTGFEMVKRRLIIILARAQRRSGTGPTGNPQEKLASRCRAPSVPHSNLPDLVSRPSADLDLDVIAERSQKAHEPLKGNFV